MGGGGKGGGNNGGGSTATANGNGATGNGDAAFQGNRGLDSGLAKSAPSAVGLSQRNYRAYRRRLDLFSRQCMRRGKDTAIEGAYLVLSQLQDTAWDATESIDYDDVELAENPFSPIRDMLDLLFQHEEEVELPERCQEFFEQFSREKGEELQAYIVRHQSMLRKLKELQVEVPPLLAGWHLLSRSGVPRWTHPQVKAMCNGTLNVKNVAQALVRMFGGDSKPNARDSVLRGGEVHYIDGYEYEPEDEEDIYYGYEEEWYPEDHEAGHEEIAYVGDEEQAEELPVELEEANLAVDEAYVNYLDSRRRMKELALARGFYPIVALDMGNQSQNYNNGGNYKGSKGAGKGGKGGKGKSKGKGKGKNPTPGGKRFAFGRRSTTTSKGDGQSGGGSSSFGKGSTTSGSTSQHGPRFKRYRLPANGIKEVPDDVNVFEELNVQNASSAMDLRLDPASLREEIHAVQGESGWAVMDSGATRTVCGSGPWDEVLEYLAVRGKNEEIEVSKEVRDFRFGDGVILRSLHAATIPVCVAGEWRKLTVHILPGTTPLLLARPDLERWDVEMKYGKGQVLVGGKEVKTARTNNGHYMINLYDDVADIMLEEELDKEVPEEEVAYLGAVMEDDPDDLEDECYNVVVDIDYRDAEEMIGMVMAMQVYEDRKLKFWECYVDQGNLGEYLKKNYSDVEVKWFTLPLWDFREEYRRRYFINSLEDEKPHHVFMAPECRLWSPMQHMNYRGDRKEELQRLRDDEEAHHLVFYSEVHREGKKVCFDTTLEQPAEALSWKTETLEAMKGYYETVLDRCRTKLKANPGDRQYAKKPTRFRSTSREVVEAVNLRCKCRDGHVQMMGRGSRLKEMQNYEAALVKLLGDGIYTAMEKAWMKRQHAEIMMMEVVEKTTPELQHIEQNKELVKLGGVEALKSVAMLHRQLGHPNGAKLVEAIKERQLPFSYVQVARKYRCPTCISKSQPKAVKVATLYKAPHFNHTLSVDTFHLMWKGEKKKVLCMLDEFSRYEVDCEIKEEVAAMEIALMESTWMRAYGFPKRLRTDASGPHQGEEFAEWTSRHGMQLELIPRGAHHRLGILERNHAIRRKQLEVLLAEEPDISLEEALQVTSHQRNRLSSVHGSSPAAIAFGHVPSEGGNADEPGPEAFGDSTQGARAQRIREAAAVAFHKANADLAVRTAILHRARVEEDELDVGQHCFYWKPATNKLDPYRWRGPCTVVAVEKADDRNSSIYWIVHGSSLVRCLRQQLRHETVPERFERQSLPNYLPSLKRPLQNRLRLALQPVRGPVRAVDLTHDAQFPTDFTGDPVSADASRLPELEQFQSRYEQEGRVSLRSEAARSPQQPTEEPSPEQESPAGVWAPPPGVEDPSVGEAAAVQSGDSPGIDAMESTSSNEAPRDPRNQISAEEDSGEKKDIDMRTAAEKRLHQEALQWAMNESMRHNRRLDGLPPSRQSDGQPAVKAAKTDEIHYVDVTEDEILQAVVENRLTKEEKQAFLEAKRKSLEPWCENDAWRRVKRTGAPEGTIVPMRFLLRYKEQKPHARVILQGFRHRDVLESKLDTESPTLSRLGKYLILQAAVQRRWKIATMDVKSAFLQSDYITEEVELYGEPTADMRRLLSEMVGLKEDEVMRMMKPAFGDVRAPRQWNETADRSLTQEVGMMKHQLDGCIYMSVRAATTEDEEYLVSEVNGHRMVMDGLMGLHVDDIVVAGEGVFNPEDVKEPAGEPSCFAERLYVLLNRFKFGSVDYGEKMVFCGCQLQQSVDLRSVTLDLENYIRHTKPITLEKARKQDGEDKLTPREQSMLRGLLGALAWPANQVMPHLAASVSLAQAATSTAKVANIAEANKILRFAKETADTPLVLRAHGEDGQIRFGCYTDASWATRPDGSSQGGWLVFVASENEMNSNKPFPLTIIDWASRKLPRVCRSSLSAEAQTMSSAVDNLEWVKTLYGLMIWPGQRADNEEVMKWLGASPCITDARALFDASTSSTPGMKLAEKRTAIEIKIAIQRLEACAGMMRWCNSEQQLADGVTKAAARQKFAMELKRRVHCLRYDPEHVAAKKVKSAKKEEEQDELEQASKEFENQRKVQEGIYKVEDMSEEEKEEIKVCMLKGCTLAVETGRKYCSKRHYHADQHKKKNSEDSKRQKTSAGSGVTAGVWTMVLASEASGVEAAENVVCLNYFGIVVYLVFTSLCAAVAYLIGRHWRGGAQPEPVRGQLPEVEMVEETEDENEDEAEERRRQQYLHSRLEEVSDHEYWMSLHHHDMESSEDNDEPENQQNEGDNDDENDYEEEHWYEGIARMSRSEVRFLRMSGYHIWTDAEADRIRSLEEATWKPSIEEVLTPNAIAAILAGEPTDVQVPGFDEEWEGMSVETRRLYAQRLDDALLLGLHVEEITVARHEEAVNLRKSLHTLRTLERQVASARLSSAVAVHDAASSVNG